MRQLRRHASVLQLPAVMLLVMLLHGCTHWVPLPEPKGIAGSPHSTFRLSVTGERSKVIVKHPTVVGDSIVWEHHGRQALPLKRVNYAEVHQNDPVATGFFVLAGALFIAAFVLVNSGGTSISL